MQIEMSALIVEDHHRRLREAAQTPMPLFARIWALVRRRRPPAQVVLLPPSDAERLAA